MLIMQRFKMEAVQTRTSTEVHRSHVAWPRTQRPMTSYTRAKGMSIVPTRRSETASDTMRRLDAVRSLRVSPMAAQTKRFPSTVPTMIRPKMTDFSALGHTTTTSGDDSRSVVPFPDPTRRPASRELSLVFVVHLAVSEELTTE